MEDLAALVATILAVLGGVAVINILSGRFIEAQKAEALDSNGLQCASPGSRPSSASASAGRLG